MSNIIFSPDLIKLNPSLLITQKDSFESTGLNMAMRIWSISSTVLNDSIAKKLNKVLESDKALNGILYYTNQEYDMLELFCFISTETPDQIPTCFYNHYSRLLSEVYLANKLFGGKEYQFVNRIVNSL